jgi:hypothetical protein
MYGIDLKKYTSRGFNDGGAPIKKLWNSVTSPCSNNAITDEVNNDISLSEKKTQLYG